jgi:hypothetical protein
MLLALRVGFVAAVVFASSSDVTPAKSPGETPAWIQLSDTELDAIIDRGEWPSRVQKGKMEASTRHSGWVPRYAAEAVIDELLTRNDVKREVIYSESDEQTRAAPGSALVIERVSWQGRVREGKSGDLRKLHRAALREIESKVVAAAASPGC